MFREKDLADRIERAGGESHIDRNRSAPFKYAMVLVTVHNFGAAASYLWRAGRVAEATHIVILGLYYGMLAPHTPLDQAKPQFTSDVSAAVASPIDVIRLWTQHCLMPTYPVAAAEYILCLGLYAGHGIRYIRGADQSVAESYRLHSLQCQYELLQDLLTCVNRHQVSSKKKIQSTTYLYADPDPDLFYYNTIR